MQFWSRDGFDVDWSPLTHNLVIADFNGDGRSDVLFQPLTAGTAASLILGNATGPVFTTAQGALPVDVAVSADSAVLVAGQFAGSGPAGLLIQATLRGGNNSIANNVASGIHPRSIVLPTLSLTSVSMAGIGIFHPGRLFPDEGRRHGDAAGRNGGTHLGGPHRRSVLRDPNGGGELQHSDLDTAWCPRYRAAPGAALHQRRPRWAHGTGLVADGAFRDRALWQDLGVLWRRARGESPSRPVTTSVWTVTACD